MEIMPMPRLYGTLGPACLDPAILSRMLLAGMTGLRINLSHGTLASCLPWLEAVRRAEVETGCHADILIDLQGPELRLGDFSPFETEAGQLLTLGEDGLPFPAPALTAIRPGDRLLADDGAQLWQVLEAGTDSALVQVIHGGLLLPRKSVALPPERPLALPVLTGQDRENLRLAVTLGIRQVMLPFVHGREDVLAVRAAWRALTEEPLEVFAKVEDPQGVAGLTDFMEEADVVVIARGDLGSHIPLPKLPVTQMEVSRLCRERGRPFLVVTQMLHSMLHSPTPTRAEVTDIAYAVVSGASALMLTGETAVGEYPAEAMEIFAETARAAYEYMQA